MRKQIIIFGILSADKCRNHCSLCIDCRSVLGINPEGIKTVSGIFQEYADRLRNEFGFTKLDSASCPRPSGRAVLDGFPLVDTVGVTRGGSRIFR